MLASSPSFPWLPSLAAFSTDTFSLFISASPMHVQATTVYIHSSSLTGCVHSRFLPRLLISFLCQVMQSTSGFDAEWLGAPESRAFTSWGCRRQCCSALFEQEGEQRSSKGAVCVWLELFHLLEELAAENWEILLPQSWQHTVPWHICIMSQLLLR